MNFTSLYYFKELTQDLNMTQTARRLYISQQTLSNHILRLEEYYKIPLFTRRHGLKLTPAGQQLLNFATKVLNDHKQLQDLFIDMRHEKRGFLRFGASPLRATKSLPHILPAFSAQYPDVEIHLLNDNSETLQSKLFDGELDLALCILDTPPQAVTKASLLLRDQVFLCVPETILTTNYPQTAAKLKDKSLSGANVKDFAKLPFMLPIPSNKLGKSVALCFDEAGYTPQVYLSAKYVMIENTIAEHNLSAFFMTQTSVFAADPEVMKKINVFPLLYNNAFVYLDLYLMRSSAEYQSAYTNYFADLLKQHFNAVNAARLAHKVEAMTSI